MDDSFKKAAINVPRLSGFDKSHQNLLTTKCGTLTPILVDELIPGTKVNLKLALNASLPPLASDTFMRCSVKVEAFAVPFRLLDGGFEAWFTDEPKEMLSTNASGSIVGTSTRAYLPCIEDSSVSGSASFDISKMGNGSLSDYLGCKSVSQAFLRLNPISAMPFLAYHRVWNDWYRNSLVQKECFLPVDAYQAGAVVPNIAASSPFQFHQQNSYVWATDRDMTLADGHHLLDLRQRNFGLDYFTTATPQPQQGSASGVSMTVSGGSTSFTIAELRAANSMQQFKERNNLLGNLYVEQCYGRYGVRPSDGIAQRSIYLGRGEFEVYSKGIYQAASNVAQGDSDADFGPQAMNPFGSVGTRYGSAYAQGENFLVNFEAKEPCYLMVMATLVPRVTYPDGIHRRFMHYTGSGSLVDLANPILQNVGPQQIFQYELSSGLGSSTFGWTDRYAEFKTMSDELHGLLRTGQSLESFALQRSISGSVQINDSFLQIPTNYMDKVTAAYAWMSSYGCWIDTFFDYKVAMPLSKYSLPSLQDPAYEHGKTIVVSKGGSKL